MAKINKTLVHETRNCVELTPDEVRAAIASYAQALVGRKTFPDDPPRGPVGAVLRVIPSSQPSTPPVSADELRLGGGVSVVWSENHVPARYPAAPPTSNDTIPTLSHTIPAPAPRAPWDAK